MGRTKGPLTALPPGGRMPEPMDGGFKPESLPCCRFRLLVMAVGCGIRRRVALFRLGMLRLISSWVVGWGAFTANKKEKQDCMRILGRARVWH